LILRHGDDADAKGQKKGNVFFHGPNVNQAIEWTLRKIASEGVVYYGKSQVRGGCLLRKIAKTMLTPLGSPPV
jgi:hypothetical protein